MTVADQLCWPSRPQTRKTPSKPKAESFFFFYSIELLVLVPYNYNYMNQLTF